MENPRTTAARDNDDHELIEGAVADSIGGGQGSLSGGRLAQDVATQADQATISDPDGVVRPQKDDDIHNNQARRSGKPRDMTG